MDVERYGFAVEARAPQIEAVKPLTLFEVYYFLSKATRMPYSLFIKGFEIADTLSGTQAETENCLFKFMAKHKAKVLRVWLNGSFAFVAHPSFTANTGNDFTSIEPVKTISALISKDKKLIARIKEDCNNLRQDPTSVFYLGGCTFRWSADKEL